MNTYRGVRLSLLIVLLALSAGASVPGAGDVKDATRPRAAAVTGTQFEKAVQIANLAAERKLSALSLKAIRDALRGGPPVVDPAHVQRMSALMRAYQGKSVAASDFPPAEQYAGAKLLDLAETWRRRGFPAAEVYATLAEVVLPEARPAEVFLYAPPLADGYFAQPRSVGGLLAEQAARAGRLDELRRKAEARAKQPLGEVKARVLSGLADLAAGDAARTKESLTWLRGRFDMDTGPQTAELACLIALPALDKDELAPAAVPVLERAAGAFAASLDLEQAGRLRRLLARRSFAAGRPDEGRKQLQALETLLPTLAEGERFVLLMHLAHDYARAGQLALSLDKLGEFDAVPLRRRQWPSLDLFNGQAAYFARQLAGRPARERYDVLKAWTLPADGKAVRLFGACIPTLSSPPEFGVPAPTSEIFSTADKLLEAARELGKLDELAAAVEPFRAKKVANADSFFWLVQSARGKGAEVEPELKQLRPTLEWPDYLVARACLADPQLKKVGEALTGELLREATTRSNDYTLFRWRGDLKCNLRYDLAASRAGRVDALKGSVVHDAGLAHWHPSVRLRGGSYDMGMTPDWWVADGSRVAQISGPSSELLYFDYPLAGKYEFTAETNRDGSYGGSLGYAGLVAEAPNSVLSLGLNETLYRACDWMVPNGTNRFTVQAEPGKVRYLVNDRPYFEDEDAGPTSPWLHLFARRTAHTVFRKASFRGTPEIPREVRLCQGDRLDGWACSFYFEKMPARLSPQARTRPAGEYFDWSARDGEIVGPRRGIGPLELEPTWQPYHGMFTFFRSLTPEAIPSLLFYFRPMRPGEEVRYEFYYKPGEVLVHPALTRLAFLLEPEGVKLHWLTNGGEKEWSGLPADNAVAVPNERRGPAKLPLKPDAWNTAKLALHKDGMTLELNGVPVYERKLKSIDDLRFGLFRYKDRTAARVRNVVLTGNWPEKLSPELMAAPFALAAPAADAEVRRALIDGAHLPERPIP